MKKLVFIALIAISGCSKYNAEQYKKTLITCIDYKIENEPPHSPAALAEVKPGEITRDQLYDCQTAARRIAYAGAY